MHLHFQKNVDILTNKSITWPTDRENKYTTEETNAFLNWDFSKKENQSIIHFKKEVFTRHDLNKKQKFIYDIVHQHFTSQSKTGLKLACYGRPGTGKSRVIHALRHLLGKSCKIAAFTGSAGFLVYGQTIHSLLRIRIGPNQINFKGANLLRMEEIWKDINYLIIDEVSLI